MEKRSTSAEARKSDERSRLMPLVIAGGFCFLAAVVLGFGTWRLFGTAARERGDTARFLERFGMSSTSSPVKSTTQTTTNETPKQVPPVTPAPAVEPSLDIKGAVAVDGGETAVGGGTSKRPLQRVNVTRFLIGETEVTNTEYYEFVKATGHKVPPHWEGDRMPDGTEDFPVVNVSVDDAEQFCLWKSKQLGYEVRLPTYAEWERAAAGSERFKYPWGNDWNEAAISSEKTRRAFPVKSFELNRSPFGAYDMVGNVWEWTSVPLEKSELVSEAAISKYTPSASTYLVLGGSFNEDRSKLANSFWTEIDGRTRDKSVGFRYVIIPDKNQVKTNPK